MWKVVNVCWDSFVNILTMECGECGLRFRWPSRVSLAQCPNCRALAYWHDFNGSEDRPWPVATVALEDPHE